MALRSDPISAARFVSLLAAFCFIWLALTAALAARAASASSAEATSTEDAKVESLDDVKQAMRNMWERVKTSSPFRSWVQVEDDEDAATVADMMNQVGSITCVPATSALLEEHEGRHLCAYDSELGYRAVGVGYNLDDRSTERKREMATILADYDKVYSGEQCLNNLQANTLLTMDSRRALLKAGERTSSFDNFCCEVQAALADVAFSRGTKELGTDFDETMKMASTGDWKGSAKELKRTGWCGRHEKRCHDDVMRLRKGCGRQEEEAEVMSVF